MRALAALFVTAALSACGSAARDWTQADTDGANAQVNASLSLESICSRDGGPCPAAPVRSVESGMFCNAESMLVRHRQPVPSGSAEGITCQRRAAP